MPDASETTVPRRARIWRDETHARRYQFQQTINSGGFGSVFLARDTSFDRNVAIKTLHADMATPEIAAKFLNEAKALGRINSPYVVKGFDQFRETEDGVEYVYLVMEYVEGERTLSTLLKENPGGLPFDEARRLAAELLDALEAAHASNSLHRDVKPGNVLVTLDGHVKLSDFGIARDTTTVNTYSILFGSEGYTPGEESKAQGPWTDLFSFGAVFFRLLTGQDPFRTAEIGWAQVLIQRSPARPLSAVRPDLGVWTGLEKFLADLLQHDPAPRQPKSAREAKTLLMAIGNAEDHRARAEADRQAARIANLAKAIGAARDRTELARLEAQADVRRALEALAPAIAAASERIAFAEFESDLAAHEFERAESRLAALATRREEARARWIAAIREALAPMRDHVSAVLAAAAERSTNPDHALAAWRKLRASRRARTVLTRAESLCSRAGLPEPGLTAYDAAVASLEALLEDSNRARRAVWFPRAAGSLLTALLLVAAARFGPDAIRRFQEEPRPPVSEVTVRQLLDTAEKQSDTDPSELLPALDTARRASALDPTHQDARRLVREIEARMSLAWSREFDAALDKNDYRQAGAIADRFQRTFPGNAAINGMRLRLSREQK